MTQTRWFSGTAIPTVLSVPIVNPTDPVIVPLITGLPASYPFEITVDPGVYSGTSLIQEEMLVTGAPVSNGNGTWTLPVTRGWDGSTVQPHSANAVVVHTTSGKDSNDARSHIDNSAGVHGITGNVVGDTDTQTLSNKTLNGVLCTGWPTVAAGVADKAYVDNETTRAETAEGANATAIASEVTRAEAAEAANATAIAAEVTRAEGAETTNATAITTANSALTAAKAAANAISINAVTATGGWTSGGTSSYVWFNQVYADITALKNELAALKAAVALL